MCLRATWTTNPTKNSTFRAGDMTQQLRVPAALAENLGLILFFFPKVY